MTHGFHGQKPSIEGVAANLERALRLKRSIAANDAALKGAADLAGLALDERESASTVRRRTVVRKPQNRARGPRKASL